MLKLTLSAFLTFLLTTVVAQPKVKLLTSADIPSSIKYSGTIIYAVQFSDSVGNNIVLATETGETKSATTSEDSDAKDARLYVWHYLVSGDTAKLLWKLTDYEKECPFDIYASFLKKSFAITDINNDGKSEVWMMYKLGCRSDVSPVTLKLFMYENGVKAAMRGTTKTQVGEHQFMGGNYSLDENFKKAALPLRAYAETLWKKNVLENWE